MVLPLDVAAMLGFFAIVGVLLIIDRKNIEFHYGIVIRRWKHGQQVMDKWIFAHRRFLEIFGSVGVVLGIIVAVGGLALMIYASSVLNIQSAALILPTAGDFQYPTSAIIGVPFWFWIVAVFVVLTAHEPMHAIFSRLAGIPVRSWGVMTLFVVPLGAFVDPDMKKVGRLRLMQKLKIFAGGSFGNFIVGSIFFLILLLLSFGLFVTVTAQSTIPETPAAAAGVDGALKSVDGIEIKNIADLSAVLKAIPPGNEVEVVTERGVYTVVTAAPPNGGEGSYLGLSFRQTRELSPEYHPWSGPITTLVDLFRWLVIFNIGIGVFNVLPLRPFDGGHMFQAIFERILGDKRRALAAINVTSVFVLAIVLYSILGTNLVGAFI